MESNIYKAARMTRWLAYGTLAVVLACLLVGCNGDSLAPSPTPTEAELTEPTPTAEPTLTPTPESTPTSTPAPTHTPSATPEPTLKPIDLNPSILDQFPATERSCLLFNMEEDRLDRIFKQETSATAEEIEAIAGCISRDTVIALHLGGIANVLGSVSGETSACAVDRLQQVEKDALVVASIGLLGNDTVVLGYDEEAMQDLVGSTWWSVFLCLNKEEWTTLSAKTGLNVDEVSIDALRCFLNELGPLGFFEFSEAAEGATPSLELFSAAESCGIDLESLLPTPAATTMGPEPTRVPTLAPQPTVVAPQPLAMTVLEINGPIGRRVPLMTGWVTTEFRLYRPDVVPVLIETDAFFAGVGTLQVGFGPVSEQDREDARRNGVDFREFPVALQSVAIMVNPDNGFVDCLTVAQLRALWRPDSDITTWRDLDPDWPDEAINLAGPTPDRPAFDLFTEAVIGQTGASRDDYSASPEGGIVIQFVNTSPNGLEYGLYGLHIDEREVKLVAIETAGGGCATPSHETIRRGEYAPLTRQHTILVNIFALDYFPAVRDFLEFYVWTALDLSYQYWHVYVPISEEQMNTNLENLAL